MTSLPRIGDDNGIKFYVYADDHNPPHVHAMYGESEALIVIATATILKGSLPGKKAARAEAWVAANKAFAIAEWKRLNP